MMDHSESHAEDRLWGAAEILPGRLYYAPLKFFPPEVCSESDEDAGSDQAEDEGAADADANSRIRRRRPPIHYFSIDEELVYWNFFLDFGPLNLGQLHRFCSKLNDKLSDPRYRNHVVCYYSGAEGEARANASFLICAWSMLYLGRTAEEAYRGFRGEGRGSTGSTTTSQGDNASSPPRRRARRSSSSNASSSSSGGGRGRRPDPSPFAELHPMPPFHDASPVVCTYDLSVWDCLLGLEKARTFGFFKFGNAPDPSPSINATSPDTDPPRSPADFDVDEYEHFEQVENGDLNWIVSGKIAAFAGPQAARAVTPEGFCMLTPADYIPYFRSRNVGLVIRLNKRCYDERDFVRAGMRHVEHYYLDGSCPPSDILHAVVADMERVEDDVAMAIHCKAGLGRTGTCIGAYLMKHYRLTAREVIGWMRICRPGMVIGPQQHFLADVEGLMWQEGEAMRSRPTAGLVAAKEGATTPERAKRTAATVSPSSATPSARPAGSPGGGHVSIVTPDGRPLALPTTPVVARRLDLKVDATTLEGEDVAMAAASPESSEGGKLPAPSSSSSLPTMDALTVDSGGGGAGGDAAMREGDQANALLSRRLDQFHARHQHDRSK